MKRKAKVIVICTINLLTYYGLNIINIHKITTINSEDVDKIKSINLYINYVVMYILDDNVLVIENIRYTFY